MAYSKLLRLILFNEDGEIVATDKFLGRTSEDEEQALRTFLDENPLGDGLWVEMSRIETHVRAIPDPRVRHWPLPPRRGPTLDPLVGANPGPVIFDEPEPGPPLAGSFLLQETDDEGRRRVWLPGDPNDPDIFKRFWRPGGWLEPQVLPDGRKDW